MSKPTPALLRNVRLFSDLDEKDLESLAEEFNERRFSAGDKIALEGEGGLMFFVVESGELSVEVHGEAVSTMGPGSSFGEIALIDRRPRTATVTAVDDVNAYGLPVFVFRPFVEARPRSRGSCSSRWPTASAAAEARSIGARPESARADSGHAKIPEGGRFAAAWRYSASASVVRAPRDRLRRSPDRLTGDRLDAVELLADAAAEDDAANTARDAARGDHAGRLSFGGRARRPDLRP